MKQLVHLKSTITPSVTGSIRCPPLRRVFLFVPLMLACFAVSQAVLPPPDGGDPGQNTAEGNDALFSLTTGVENTAIGFQALANNEQIDNSGVGWHALTFEERVAHQRAIEEVYWRHRIWPEERSDPKPSLDAVMPQAQLEKKVADYLRNSQALEDYWQRPITPEQLQAEMDRMAQHTKQPQVLRELFEALGNDPFVIAECLAKPVLAERLVADLSVQDETSHAQSARTQGLRGMSMATTLGNVAYTLPKIFEGDPPCTDDTWTATNTINAPTARFDHTAVWTGSEMIVWGGRIPTIMS
jgi:hypothetical protein